MAVLPTKWIKIVFLLALSDVFPIYAYLGARIGVLMNSSFGLTGEVWAVNGTHLQITNITLLPADGLTDYAFYFSTDETVGKVVGFHRYVEAELGAFLQPIAPVLDEGLAEERLVVAAPTGSRLSQWTYFGLVAEKQWVYLAAVSLAEKQLPEPYCCLQDERQTTLGLVGKYYGVASAPISILDAVTFYIPQFSFEGSKPPDGWIYAGKGAINKTSGVKVFVVGRDVPGHHCPLREDYRGEIDVVVRLPEPWTVFDLDYISIYSYNIGVDFGHVRVRIPAERKAPIPAYLPPVRMEPLRMDDFSSWTRPRVVMIPQQDEAVELSFSLGFSAGAKMRAMRRVCDTPELVWYVNGEASPEVWVQRGVTYRLRSQGGLAHPLYISSESLGGFVEKPITTQKNIVIYAGGSSDGAGSQCTWVRIGDSRANAPDGFRSFDEFKRYLLEHCEHPYVGKTLLWKVSEVTPTEVYYNSYSTAGLGGPIRVCAKIVGDTRHPICID